MRDRQVLAGKSAIVTGAGRGIGRSIALGLAHAGADVTLAARSADQLAEVARDIQDHGVRALAVPTDVTNSEQVSHMVHATVHEFGRVDILVNNSGVVSTMELVETTDEEWDRVLNTNFRGAFLATREVGKHLVAQRSGKIINIASSIALKGMARHAVYGASKGAIISFTKSMAMEWARYGIQVNAVAPGYFATDINAAVRAETESLDRILRTIPARRMGEKEELVPWVVLLASSASNFMTGETIVLDGGQSA